MKLGDRRQSSDPVSARDLFEWARQAWERKQARLLTVLRDRSDLRRYNAQNALGHHDPETGKKPGGRPANVLGGRCIRGHLLTIRNTSPTETGYRCLDCRRVRTKKHRKGAA